METSSFLPAKSKLEAVARLYAAAQTPAEPLGPGSKEKKSVLTKTAERLSLDVDASAPKDILACQILEKLGQTWDRSFSSTGQTITLRGLNAILAATEAELQRRAVRELRGVTPTLPDWFAPARDKLEAVRRISSITGGRPQDLGPGSKERKSVLTDLVDNLGLPLDSRLTKTKLAEAIAATLDMPWNDSCWSSGQTVTLNGLNAVLAGAEQRLLHGHGHSVKQLRLQQEARLLVTALAASCPQSRLSGSAFTSSSWVFLLSSTPTAEAPSASEQPSSTTPVTSCGTSRPMGRRSLLLLKASLVRHRSTIASLSCSASKSAV